MNKILKPEGRIKAFSPEALAVVASATELRDNLHHPNVGREHVLFAFVNGSAGEAIARAFELCGLTQDAVRSAIEYFDGPKRPVRPHHVKYVHQTHDMAQPFLGDFLALNERQLFPQFSPNADVVFKMALLAGDDTTVSVEDLLRVFLREVGRSEGESRERRVMQVIHHVVPDLRLGDIKDIAMNKQEQHVNTLKRQRHGLITELGTTASPRVDRLNTTISEQEHMLGMIKLLRWSLIRQPGAIQV